MPVQGAKKKKNKMDKLFCSKSSSNDYLQKHTGTHVQSCFLLLNFKPINDNNFNFFYRIFFFFL